MDGSLNPEHIHDAYGKFYQAGAKRADCCTHYAQFRHAHFTKDKYIVCTDIYQKGETGSQQSQLGVSDRADNVCNDKTQSMGKKNKSSNAKISCPLPDYILVMDEDTHNSFGDKKGYGDVVQVSLNHRLNIYGFLDLSNYGSEYALSGIVGMEDIVAALKWVRDNISAFGGDPDNVTIFGESGGGGKVRTLMQMGSADGLYHKAIVDSGILPSRGLSAQEEKQEALQFAQKIVEKAGGIESLKAMDNYHLQNLIETVSEGSFVNWGPVPCTGSYSGEWLNTPFREESLRIPIIVGSVYQELVPRPASICDKNALSEEERFRALEDAYGKEPAPAIRDAFRIAYPELNLYYASLIDSMVRIPTVQFCKERAAAGGKDTYNFLFAFETRYKGGLLSTHADELVRKPEKIL